MNNKQLQLFLQITDLGSFSRAEETAYISKQAMLDLIFGREEPSGRLAFALPKDMEGLERHMEDTPFDYPVYEDEFHGRYGFFFGMNWSGLL